MIVAVSCLVVSFFVDLGGLGRAESTLLSKRVGCSRGRRRRKNWRRHLSLGRCLGRLLTHHHHLLLLLLRVGSRRIEGQGRRVAKTLA